MNKLDKQFLKSILRALDTLRDLLAALLEKETR